MNKLTFLSLSASLLAFPVHAAETPKVTLAGELKFQAAAVDQEGAFETGAFSRDVKFANDTEIDVKVEGITDSGLTYGAIIQLEADVTADARGEGLNSDKTYLYGEGRYGRIELGNQEGVPAYMAINSTSIAHGTGGTEGDFELYTNPVGALGAGFVILPNLPIQTIGGNTEDTTKIVYYTPKFSGFQFGIDYAPDSGNGGTAAGFTTDADAGDYENLLQAGLSYEHEWSGVGFAASIVGETGESEVAAQEDLAAYQAGLKLHYDSFSIAGSYGDWGDSGQAIGANADVTFWTAGIAYENGPLGLSATYFDSDAAGNAFNNIALSADYQLAPGLMPYAEVSFFEFDEAGTPIDNEGTVFLTGAMVSF